MRGGGVKHIMIFTVKSNIKDGTYKVTEAINIYSHHFGHLEMGVGTIFKVLEHGMIAHTENITFPPILLELCKEQYAKIYD